MCQFRIDTVYIILSVRQINSKFKIIQDNEAEKDDI